MTTCYGSVELSLFFIWNLRLLWSMDPARDARPTLLRRRFNVLTGWLGRSVIGYGAILQSFDAFSFILFLTKKFIVPFTFPKGFIEVTMNVVWHFCLNPIHAYQPSRFNDTIIVRRSRKVINSDFIRIPFIPVIPPHS